MNINITYLAHSGFLVEWDNSYWLFDYYKGQLPDFDKNKKLFVFVSHSHYDHFNKDIFQLEVGHPNICYLLASDIKLSEKTIEMLDISGDLSRKIEVVKPAQIYNLKDNEDNDILVKTLTSTDSGVAFLIQYLGKTIYHAGDLNLWVWKEEDKQFNNNMTARFNKEMKILKDQSIDVAFAPLDPRQEEWYLLGMEALLKTAKVKYLFPMHFWDKPEIIKKYLEEREDKSTPTKIMEVNKQGQTWIIEI